MSDHGQVQLRLPVHPPSSPHESHCGSPAAHISLRRFAQGYVFGSPARLGEIATSNSSPSQQSSKTASPPSPPHTFAAPAVDFASCAARAALHSNRPLQPPRRRRSSAPESAVDPLLFAEPSSSSSSRGPALPVRIRPIERKAAPKRCRGTVSIDALAVMFEDVLGGSETANWRKHSYHKKLRSADGPRSRTGPAAAFGVSLAWGEEVVAPKPPKEDKNTQVLETISKAEDEDTADELSFLVDKCDLDAERKQSMFMPYIT